MRIHQPSINHETNQQTIVGPYNHILGLGLQKGNAEPIHFVLDINVWHAGGCYQVNSVSFGHGTIDKNTWNKIDKGKIIDSWIQVPFIKILKAGQIASFFSIKIISIRWRKTLTFLCHYVTNSGPPH